MTSTAPRLRHRHGTSCTWAAEKRPLGGHRASYVGPRLLASLQARKTSSRQPRGVSAKMLPLHIADMHRVQFLRSSQAAWTDVVSALHPETGGSRTSPWTPSLCGVPGGD